MKKIASVIIAFSVITASVFAQSAEYSKYLAEAKKYEEKKQWAFALDAYYDAIGCSDEPSLKIDALNGYIALSESIKNGNPGLGKYNPFTMHDEWKKLLIDAEKLGSSICKFELHLGKFEQGDLDYETRTATYKSKVQYEISDRYKKTIGVIEDGYKAAYKSDWTDLPEAKNWPLYSVSSAKNAKYDVAGAKIVETPVYLVVSNVDYYNAFSRLISTCDYFGNDYPGRTLYDYKFNIVDEKGNELVKGKRWLLYDNRWGTPEISIDRIPIETMNLIEDGKAFINPVAVCLEYGKYNFDDDNLGYRKTKAKYNDKDGRSFIKNLPEVQLDLNKSMIYCWNKTEDLTAVRFFNMLNEYKIAPLIKSYFEKLSVNTRIVDNSETLKFEIPLDNAYTYESGVGNVCNLKDESGKVWKISEENFLAILKSITGLEYSIKSSCFLQRNATDAEKIEYEKSREASIYEAVKLYFEKIAANGRIHEYMGYNLFEMPLDNSYDYRYFTLKDSSGKELKISNNDFLAILKKITNQEYRINGTRLSRNPTKEEAAEYEKTKQ